ncbi:DUF1189 domain-containing protein [Jeotgalibacillus proteolyticus]|uniref:DUF1189 domain-containing protein n=1 Tax=Jeotgalibacillus proteolyticus TaxID=2082395 RepID=A0A2S5GEX1_9BACL|nr:DUF1189 domain-containing protein [Jeotgalibacillus proteolyticus]PPA71423.1 DUF1189 domain-containing protein [Jeotgalibacillus proteolyticus]
MNVFKQLWKSLYSPKDIASFRFQGIGKTLLFLFILSFLSLIPVIIQVTQLGNAIFSEGEDLLQNEVPSFEVQNGTLVSENEEPVTIDGTRFTVIVDDSGEVTEQNLRAGSSTIALLKEEIVVAVGPERQSYPYTMFTGITFSTEGISSLLSSIEGAKYILYFFIFFVMYIFSTGLIFLKVLLFSALGLLFAKSLEKKLSFRHSFRITSYSVVLSTVFLIIITLAGSAVPAVNLVNWLVTSIMLFLSIKEIPSRKRKASST